MHDPHYNYSIGNSVVLSDIAHLSLVSSVHYHCLSNAVLTQVQPVNLGLLVQLQCLVRHRLHNMLSTVYKTVVRPSICLSPQV